MTEADNRKYRAPALEKGLDILELLATTGGGLTTSQMSAELGRSVSELFRMIQVLEFRGYIEATPTGYRLSNRLFTLGLAQAPTRSLTEAALPVMRALSAQTQQSCHLVVRSEDQIVVVARVESPGDIGFAVRLGYRRDVIAASSGLLLYGCAAPDQKAPLRAMLEAKHPAARVADFVERAEAAARQGWVQRPSDFVTGVTDLVSPIMAEDGIVATLIVPWIEQTPARGDLAATSDHARLATRAITEAMGVLPG